MYYMSLTAVNRLENVGRSDQHCHENHKAEKTNQSTPIPDASAHVAQNQPIVNHQEASSSVLSDSISELVNELSEPPSIQRPTSSIFQDAPLEFDEPAVQDMFNQVGGAFWDNQLAGSGITVSPKTTSLSPAILRSMMRSCISSLNEPQLDLKPVPWHQEINTFIDHISCSPRVIGLMNDPVKTRSMLILASFNLTIIQSIYVHVMKQLGSYHVFYDPWTDVIAFNRNNMLCFNVSSKRGNPYKSLRLYIAAWFLTICHELAHVQVRDHNAAFAGAFSFIVLERSQTFWAQTDYLEATITHVLQSKDLAQVFA